MSETVELYVLQWRGEIGDEPTEWRSTEGGPFATFEAAQMAAKAVYDVHPIGKRIVRILGEVVQP